MGAEMKQGIDKIRIHNLRGIKDVTIDLCGNNFLILGDNGTGKSSIIDCVELFFTKSIDKLAGRQEVPLKDVIPFAGSNHERSVEIQFLGADKFTKLVYASTSVRLPPPNGYEVFFERAENRPIILHRYQLTRFIENRPAERYKQISSLIGLEELDQIVSTWRKVVLEIRKEIALETGKNILGTWKKELETGRPQKATTSVVKKLGWGLVLFFCGLN